MLGAGRFPSGGQICRDLLARPRIEVQLSEENRSLSAHFVSVVGAMSALSVTGQGYVTAMSRLCHCYVSPALALSNSNRLRDIHVGARNMNMSMRSCTAEGRIRPSDSSVPEFFIGTRGAFGSAKSTASVSLTAHGKNLSAATSKKRRQPRRIHRTTMPGRFKAGNAKNHRPGRAQQSHNPCRYSIKETSF